MLSLQSPQLVELCGQSGCGKTQYLTHVIANAILPETYNGVNLCGLGRSVMLIDIDHHFSFQRMVSLLESRIMRSLDAMHAKCSLCTVDGSKQMDNTCRCAPDRCEEYSDKDCKDRFNVGCQADCTDSMVSAETLSSETHLSLIDIEQCIASCLTRFYIVRCATSVQVLVTLHSLEALLGCKRDIGIVAIDSLSAVLCTNKMSFTHERGVVIEENVKYISEIIDRICRMFGLVVITTNSLITSKQSRLRNERISVDKFEKNKQMPDDLSKIERRRMPNVSTPVQKDSLGSFCKLPLTQLFFSRMHCKSNEVCYKENSVVLFTVASSDYSVKNKNFEIVSTGLNFY
jgi:RecA/RadA recombinase